MKAAETQQMQIRIGVTGLEEQYHILVVDDDKEIAHAIEIYLTQEGLQVTLAFDGQEALQKLEAEHFHLVIMDVMMPRLDGIAATVQIRQTYFLPIIFLSAKSEDADKIIGLNIGADDYITKPFNPMELIARVKSQLRRYTRFNEGAQEQKKTMLATGDLQLDMEKKELTLAGEPVALTSTEYKIVKLLMRNMGRIFSIDEIYERVWREPNINGENTVAVHIRRIREKIEINPREPKYLKVVWGIGYKVEKY